MTWIAACLCVLVLGMYQIIIGQTLNPDSERKLLGCNVTGEWHSELGSQLQLSAAGPEVRGVYRTAVESARGAAGPSREARVVGVISDGPQPTIAFSVLWAKGSCTTWVGQCFILPGGVQVLKTLWMLRSAAESSMDNWDNTRLGEDQFICARGVESL
ncbi:avidin [Pangasianodon hypophthalmus]|uniref:avidin n=1 Tax=Pangasianodon hypophthalmus TaxID=310915 RepID=UPI000F00AC23|nr:avidin [Pangasianodon hypophthalmus]